MVNTPYHRYGTGCFLITIILMFVGTNMTLPASGQRSSLIDRIVADGKELTVSRELEIPLGTRRLTFYFGMPENDPGKRTITYYRLEGFDTEWIDAGNGSRADYTSLPAGEYRFHLSLKKPGTALGKDGHFIPVRVTSPFFRTWWFGILIIALFLSGGVLILFRLTRALRKQKNELERVVARRTMELETANLRLESLVRNDALTGVTNRRGFSEKIEEEWRRALRYGAALSLIMVDVDFFKNYNDRFGHQEGDNALKMVASTLARVFKRAGEVVARYGGEEFIILLPAVTQEETANAAEKIRTAVEKLNLPHPASEAGIVLTVSVGYSMGMPEDMRSPADLIHAADQALYRAKQNGRNRIEGILPIEG